MRRVVTYLHWKASWWDEQASARTKVREDLKDGLQAYAAKQATICHDLASKFMKLWHGFVDSNQLSLVVPARYIPV